MASLPPLALPGDRLEHLTKHRTKKPPQSQKRPPSRKFLQRQKDLVSADLKPNVAPKPNKDISIRIGSKELGQFNQLKLVPPPVPRKPFISKHNIDLGINRGDGISGHQHDRNKVHGKQSQSDNTSENELASDRNQRSILNEIKQLHSHSEKKFKGLRNNDREDVDAECQNTLNKGSRLQGPLTFSERLKASSLKQTLGSSRKPNDLSAKLRSHVIVPAKRTYKEGSEKTASPLSSPTKGKVPAFFKRRSSDSLSSHSGDTPKSANLDKMLDEEDSVSDSLSSISDRKKVVVPLPVSSLISQTSLMVDDEDLKGDSFDSTELNIDPLSALQPDSMIQHDMNDHAYYKLTDPEGNNTDLGDTLSVSDSLPSLPHGYLGRIVGSGAVDHASGYHDDRSFISVTDVMPVHGSSEISIKGEQSSDSIIPFEIERTGFDVMEESNDEDLLEEHDMVSSEKLVHVVILK